MNSKDYIHRMLYLSQLKKDYLEQCLSKEQEPDYELIHVISIIESNQNSNLDLTLVKATSLQLILPLLKVNYPINRSRQCQNHIDQITITSQQAQQLKDLLPQFIEDSNLDIQIRKKIPQLDLNQINSSTTNLIQSSQRQNKLQKSPSQYQFNTDRLQNPQSTTRIKKQLLPTPINQQPQPKSPNTKIVNVKLKKQHTEVVGKSLTHKKRLQLQSHEDLNRKISSHSFTKHKNTSSSPINETTNIQRQISQYTTCQPQLKTNSSGANIQIKALLESQQTSKTPNNNTINSNDQNADISIHLKNLISFCNQSILKKNQECYSSKKDLSTQQTNSSILQIKENKENNQPIKKSTPLLKPTEHTMIKLTELTEEDNPETARFNSEDDVRKLTNFNSKGLQKLLQSKTNQLSEQSSTQSLLSLFQRK
ncbi:unnamed protein product [Paramecium sonneborni]|uniref:Uncharacterized protein n=1 Tax=Paramecium sonneborni TaxID=65129 RepID=A0A8S1R216_9CILI|nr:unnamed protein product [Paramecium sonneborni]